MSWRNNKYSSHFFCKTVKYWFILTQIYKQEITFETLVYDIVARKQETLESHALKIY